MKARCCQRSLSLTLGLCSTVYSARFGEICEISHTESQGPHSHYREKEDGEMKNYSQEDKIMGFGGPGKQRADVMGNTEYSRQL